jgi:hypothetical protein
MGHESQIELWTPHERRSALLVSELTGFVAKQAMKTAGRGNPNHWAQVPSNRAHGVADQNTSCSFKGAANQEKFQPLGVFFLLIPFIELHVQIEFVGENANAPQAEILQRIGQYVRSCWRWLFSGVRDVTVSDAFKWSGEGPDPYASASLTRPQSHQHEGDGARLRCG